MKEQEEESKKVIRTFGLASFLNDLGSDIIYPVWPLFVTTILKANMAALGLLDGIGEALVSISKAASGFLSDRIRRRKIFIYTGYIMGALSRIGYSISTVWTHLIPFRVLDRAGKIRSAPRDAIVADVTTTENRGKSFGFLRAMDHLGAVCGVLICIALINLVGYRILFFLAAIPSLISAFLVFSLIKEKKPSQTQTFSGISLKVLDKNFRRFLFLSAIFYLGAFSYSFLLMYAKKIGFKTTFIPVLYLIYTGTASLFSIYFGKISDKAGRKPVLLLSYFFWGAVCLIFILSRSHLMIIISFVLYGAHKAALEPVQRTCVAELSPTEFRASCLGGFQMVTGLCAFPASFVAGILWESFGMVIPFYFSLILTAMSGILLLFVRRIR